MLLRAVLVLGLGAAEQSRAARGRRETAIRLGGTVRRMVSQPPLRAVVMLTMLAATARPAAAQSVHRDETPTSLFVPENGAGARIGGAFILYPTLDAALAHDSNIYNLPANTRADQLVTVRPEAVLASDFNRHYVELRAGGDIRRYFRNPAENSESVSANLLARLELAEQTTVTPEIGLAQRVEQRGTAGDIFLTDEPVTYTQTHAAIAVARDRGILGAALKGRFDRFTYDDTRAGGVPIDLGFRNVDTRRISLEATYRLAPATRLFAEAGYNAVDYREPVSRARNSTGWSMLAGIRFQPSEQLDFEAAAGYLKQDFDSPAFAPVKAINYRLSANWVPRRSFAARAAIARTVDPSPLFIAPAVVRSEYRLGVQQSFADRMLVEADAAYLTEDFRGIGRTDKYSRIGLSARYRINTNLGVAANASYRTQTGGREFDGFAAGVSVRVTL